MVLTVSLPPLVDCGTAAPPISLGMIVPDCPRHQSQGAWYLGAGSGVCRFHRELWLAGIIATVALGTRVGGALLLIKQASMMEATTGELLVRCGGAAYW